MGAWGAGIFANDTACDIRARWREGLLDGQAPAALQDELVGTWDGMDEDEIVWSALAAAQHETGRLTAAVRDRALAAIDAGPDDGWEDRAGRRAAVLGRLRAKLTGPQPAPKRLRRPRSHGPDVGPGDVLALRGRDGAFGALVMVAETFADGHVTVVNLAWDGEGDLEAVDLPALPVVWQGLNGRGERLARATTVSARRRDDAFTEAIGVIVARGVHPHRPPGEKV